MSTPFDLSTISTIIGLGNPGTKFELTRHNIGFLFVDLLADQYGGSWKTGPYCLWTTIQLTVHGSVQQVRLVKPQTFMNASGQVWPWLKKQGAQPEKTLIVHDELEKKFGSHMVRFAGSARGHNGLRSFINVIGTDFWRLRLGIDRPENKADVGKYVLQRFAPAELDALDGFLNECLALLGA